MGLSLRIFDFLCARWAPSLVRSLGQARGQTDQSEFCHFCVSLTSLSLSFLICKMDTVKGLAYKA